MRTGFLVLMLILALDVCSPRAAANKAPRPVAFDSNRPLTSPVSLAIAGVSLSAAFIWVGLRLKRAGRDHEGNENLERSQAHQEPDDPNVKAIALGICSFLLVLVLTVVIMEIQYANMVAEMEGAGRARQQLEKGTD